MHWVSRSYGLRSLFKFNNGSYLFGILFMICSAYKGLRLTAFKSSNALTRDFLF